MWRIKKEISLFSPNMEEEGPEKLRIQTLFMQCPPQLLIVMYDLTN